MNKAEWDRIAKQQRLRRTVVCERHVFANLSIIRKRIRRQRYHKAMHSIGQAFRTALILAPFATIFHHKHHHEH